MIKPARHLFLFREKLSIVTAVLFLSCLSPRAGSAAADTARFNALLRKGDSVYSQKQGYGSFLQSLLYFDSAQTIAEASANPLLLAKATVARGSVYDAWNKEPAKTIALFTEATQLFRKAGDEEDYFYAKHLIAHAYDKVADSLRAAQVLQELVAELALKDTATRHRLRFLSEMALIATEVKAYALADSILAGLVQRSWIANDPATYNYLDHYYLTQSRLDVYWRGRRHSAYLDSLARVCDASPAPLDQLYYAPQLAAMYAATADYDPAYRYRTLELKLQNRLAADKDFEKLQRALIESETAAERRQLAYEQTLRRSRTYAIWVLSLLLAVITVLSIYLHRRNEKYQAQSHSLQQLNGELDTQVGKVELLNKEIQHRVKNNLYTIYSLLHMQQDSTDNEEVIAHLEAARLRVESVAALHDHLLAGSDAVDFGAYIKVLIGKIVETLGDGRKVVTHISTEPVSLPLNTCFALSLILNEWITNSIKYAGSINGVVEMNVRIARHPGEVCIDYTDSGSGSDTQPGRRGLGTEIVRLLTAQMKGRLNAVNNHPYHYNLCIPHGQPH